jgi:hypothetical protein
LVPGLGRKSERQRDAGRAAHKARPGSRIEPALSPNLKKKGGGLVGDL